MTEKEKFVQSVLQDFIAYIEAEETEWRIEDELDNSYYPNNCVNDDEKMEQIWK